MPRHDERNLPIAALYLLASILVLLACAAQPARAQQSTAAISANLDDLPITLQRRTIEPAAQGPVTSAPEDFDKVQLVPGCLLSMEVYGIPELSGIMLRIDAAGDVSVPTLGPVHIAGSTVLQAQDAITEALVSGEILVSPVVRLNVVQFTAGYVSVSGEVQNPGRFQVISSRTLAEVLALAGGESAAAGDDIEIQRKSADGNVQPQHIHYAQRDAPTSLQSITVRPGDSVFVHRAGAVYVLGAVNRPGGYLMVNDGKLNIYQAVSLAGGTTLDAATNGMYIIRPHDEAFETIKVPFSKLVRENQSEIQLQLNDVLYVPRSGWRVTLLDGSAIIGAAVNGATYNLH